LNRRDCYLGHWNSTESRAEYDRLITVWLANGRRLPDAQSDLTVNEVVLHFWRHAENYYRGSIELGHYQRVLRILRRLWGNTTANEFGPVNLRIIRDHMVTLGWVRKSINTQLSRIKNVFRWAGEEGLVKPIVYHGLLCVAGLRYGRSAARESEPVRPVPQAHIDAIRPFVNGQVEALIDLQLLTGMRPGEACMLRACDLDMSGRVWVYRPASHKTQHNGHRREIYLGPRA
jgi:integrase